MQSLDPADKVVIALSTCPDEPTAKRIATAVVEERLATCVNRVSGLSSTYFWDGRLQDESEILLIIKTSASRIQDLQERLEELHPYELAEFIVLPVIAGNEAYLQWVREGVEKERRTE